MASISRCQERKRVYCPHCKDYVSRSLFYGHKQLYYDENLHKWDAVTSTSAVHQPEVTFEFTPGSFAGEDQLPDFGCKRAISYVAVHSCISASMTLVST